VCVIFPVENKNELMYGGLKKMEIFVRSKRNDFKKRVDPKSLEKNKTNHGPNGEQNIK
jgi:hypothetical protein